MNKSMFGVVEKISTLSPSMVRIVLGGDGLDEFTATDYTDQYINAYFIPENASYSPPFELEEVRALGDSQRPRSRRFTVRRWDSTTRRLTIDFVTHGDQGYAGAWAQRAKVGDRLQFKGPNGSYKPDMKADWHLLAGDESAISAISASVESIPESKTCLVFLIVDGPENKIEFASSPLHQIEWIYRSAVPDPDLALLEAIKSQDFPAGDFDIFVHGEAGEVRNIRKFLISEHEINIESASISPYWRRDHTDEAWRNIKKQWLADQEMDI